MTWVCETARTRVVWVTKHRDHVTPHDGFWVCGFETDDDAAALIHADLLGHLLYDRPYANRNRRPQRVCRDSDSVGSYIEKHRRFA